MPTLVRGVAVNVFAPLTSTITVVPDVGARISVTGRNQDGSGAFSGDVYVSTDIAAPAGSNFTLLSENGGGTYTDPAASGTAIQSLVSGDWMAPVRYAKGIYYLGLKRVVNGVDAAGGSSGVNSDAAGLYTVELQSEVYAPFVDAGLILDGAHTATVAINLAEVAAAPDISTTAYSALTGHKARLFSGSSTGTLPARLSSTNSARLFTDEGTDTTNLASIARTDGLSGYVLRGRVVYYAGSAIVTDIPFTAVDTQETVASFLAGAGMAWRANGVAGDGVTTKALSAGGILSNQRPVGGWWVKHTAASMNHACVGDSVNGGQQQSLSTARGALLRACRARTLESGRAHAWACYGWNGATSALYYQRALSVLADHDSGAANISVFWYPVMTQNDSDTVAARQFRAVDIINQCKKRGILPVLVTPAPYNVAGVGEQANFAAMKTFAITTAAAFGIPCCDQYAAAGNADMLVAGYRAEFGMSGSDAHPNEAAQAAMATAWLETMRLIG
jgi:hypothetical protein